MANNKWTPEQLEEAREWLALDTAFDDGSTRLWRKLESELAR